MSEQQQHFPLPGSGEAVPPMPPRPVEEQTYYPPPTHQEAAPPMPPRPEQQQPYYPPPTEHGVAPPMPPPQEQQYFPPPPPGPPPQDQQSAFATQPQPPVYNPQDHVDKPADGSHLYSATQPQQPIYNPQDHVDKPTDGSHLLPPPPKRETRRYSGEENIDSPIHYSRDPKKLVAYLVPFPKPQIPNVPPESVPQRFMIYTPPPPPFVDKPADEKSEGRVHKVQRKWQDEIREAKTGNAKKMSWKGVKGKAIKGINWGMGQTKSSNLEFLNRIGGSPQDSQPDKHAEDGHPEEDQTQATVKLEEMLLVYPSSMPGNPEEIREEFINTMLRSKTKAQRDAVIATGLLPVSAAIDILLTFIWPFGGLLEIDSVWAYASIRGAKNSRSVTKRLTSTGQNESDMLHLNFTPSPRLAVLDQYLSSRCHSRDAELFPSAKLPPSETEVLEAIGWFPSSKGGAERNWEDEQWEISEVKEDLKSVMSKGAREWDKWCRLYQKEPEKALKK